MKIEASNDNKAFSFDDQKLREQAVDSKVLVKKALCAATLLCWAGVLYFDRNFLSAWRLILAWTTVMVGLLLSLLDLIPAAIIPMASEKKVLWAKNGFIGANVLLAVNSLYYFPEGLVFTEEFHRTLLQNTLYFAIVLFFFAVMLYSEKEQRTLVEHTNILLDEKLKDITNLTAVGSALSSVLQLDVLLELILDMTVRIMKVEIVSLFLLNPNDNNELILKISRGLPIELQGNLKIRVGEGIVGKVAETGKPLLIKDIERSDIKSSRSSSGEQNKSRYHTKSLVCTPLSVKEEIIGVLSVNNKKNRSAFNDADLEMTFLLAAQIAVAVENANLYEDMQRNYVSTIRALSAAIDAKDQYTSGHSSSVTRYVIPMAKELGFSKESIVRLEYAGLLHDIGKIGIIESILNKKGRLTDEEFEIIKGHPSIGANIIQSVDFLSDVTAVVKHHHERYDGRGYPERLKGESIPVGSRLLAVADTFDAMTSDRPYRKGLPYKIAVEEIKKCSGTQFDPKAAEAFLRVYERNELPLERKEES